MTEETKAEVTFGKKLASRRFILAMLVIVTSSLMVYKGLISPENYETIIIWISGIYIVGKAFGDRVGVILANKQEKHHERSNINNEINYKISQLIKLVKEANNPRIKKNFQDELTSYLAIKHLIDKYKD